MDTKEEGEVVTAAILEINLVLRKNCL